MAELTKYEIIINELITLEAQAAVFKTKYKELSVRNSELEELISRLQKENLELKEKISKVGTEPVKNTLVEDTGIFNTLDHKEKEKLKSKIHNLLSRIEFHLSS